MTISEWADEFRVLGSRGMESAIRWRTETTPYLREIMDALGPQSNAREIILMKGAQLGGTEAGNNWLGYIIHQCPAPILVVRPTVDEARRFSRQRLDPMISTSPILRNLVRESRSREGGNSLLIKEFQGGVLFLTGSNSATGVKSMPIRDLFLDEIDEYPGDVDGQGDPIWLAKKRTAGPNYSHRKIFEVSTPTVKGLSRIEREFLASDQRRYFIPCPFCGHFDWIRWENIRWEEHNPATAKLACVGCGKLIEEHHKTKMLAGGQWRPTVEGNGERIGFHLSSLYSPIGWFPWAAAVDEFLQSKEDPLRLKNWVNTVLGETWEERGDTVEPDSLLNRLEKYPAEVPSGVGILTAAVDVQDDRIEVQVKGYGAQEESWLVAWEAIYGDPGRQKVWDEIDAFLAGSFKHQSGQKVPIACTCIDSGGHFTEEVYKFCKVRGHRRIFAVRGGSESGRPIISRPTQHNRYRVKLFTLCVDTAKQIIYSRLKIANPGPGFCHLPHWVDPEYIAQLTAEKAIPKWRKGRGMVRDWVKLRDRNEALDLEVYCLSALYILGPVVIRTLPERAEELKTKGGRRTSQPSQAPKATSLAGVPMSRKKWIDGWNG